eukprot:TRINITY_DN10293_c0_g1_i2.p1 TRINITY_DN10293_c0_g1~~TRINITY_DN10293_c0_g1_i2.p1  ORF type:complete len:123 (-),score=8.06 TRINITY_DN10293_c0_g1_i2:193-561(-)
MAHTCRKLRKEYTGREVVLYTDHIAWTELELKVEYDIMTGYLMNIMEVAPRVIFIRGVENTVADMISVNGRYVNRASVLKVYKVTKPWQLVGVDVKESKDAMGKPFVWSYIICFFLYYTSKG